ncbi:hypothetical protein V1477_010075 [Vespula maculifrons]|uniref:Uncharacterized protein n=1 Tax=Vespula maculifrons TaxID=7453 RepID=A0ABD2CBK3_VESMC
MQEATRNRERRGQFPNDSDLSPLVCSGKPVKFASLRSHLEIQIYRETGKPRETGRHCDNVGSSLTKSNEAVPTKFLDGIMRNFTLGFYMCILHEIRTSKETKKSDVSPQSINHTSEGTINTLAEATWSNSHDKDVINHRKHRSLPPSLPPPTSPPSPPSKTTAILT